MTIADAKKQLAGYPDDMHCAMALWTPPDVKEVAKQEKVKLSKSRINAVLDTVDHKQDASEGISWETIRCAIQWS